MREGRIVGDSDAEKLTATINGMVKRGWQLVGYMVYRVGGEWALSSHAFLEREVK